MRSLRIVAIALVFSASTASQADTTKQLNVSDLDAAEKLWRQASLQDYRFTFQYHEFITPCDSWSFDARISHGVPEHGGDCRQYRAEFASVPLLFKYLRRALKTHHYLIEAEFDPTLGYPISAFVAWSEAADDFFSFKVVNFQSTQQSLHQR